MKYLSRCMLLGAWLLLPGCAEVAGSVACLSGVCASKEERLSEISWDLPVLQKEGCAVIEGQYRDTGQLISGVLPGKENDVYFKQASRLSNYLLSSQSYPFKVESKAYGKIPVIVSETSKKDVTGRLLGGTVQITNDSDFYETAVLNIRKSNGHWEFTLSDDKGKKYTAFLITTKHPQIGCIGDGLVIRVANAVAGAEGGLGVAWARQLKLTKLSDGHLQLNIQNRNWGYSASRGFIETDANGNVSGDASRKKEVTLIFSGV